MSSLAWKLNRLRLMGPTEVLWRVRQQLQKRWMAHGFGLVRQPPAPTAFVDLPPFVHPGPTDDRVALCAQADAILAGQWQVFAMRAAPLGFPPEWNRDPKTGTRAPLTIGKGIDYRRESVVGDIKYLWEPARHLQLTTLALAWAQTGEQRYQDGALTLLTSWLDQCPYPMGVHWTSALELAVRLLNWAAAWQLLGGQAGAWAASEAGRALQQRWLAAVYQHCHFIAGYFSRHSSANNHLFGEYMGLYVAASVWPCWPETEAWRTLAQAGLEQEALTQNHADGVNREQATYYHHEVMDMMLLCQRVAVAGGGSLSAAFLQRLERMAEFVHALMDRSGQLPMIGDADDALMVRLAHEADWHLYRSLLASAALMFGRADFKAAAGRLDSKTCRLFGPQAGAAWQALPSAPPQPPRRAFPEGGYYLLGSGWGTPDELRAVLDCGPLGYLSIAAHGHADALAFTLSAGGLEWLVDPGTFAYHTQKRWRDHFRSTAAHNTVTVDGRDQSQIGGNFMWLHKAQARALGHQPEGDLQWFEGEHDGYRQLPDPVVHRRTLRFHASARCLEVVDQLRAQLSHEVAIHWHFAEACAVTVQDGEVLAVQGDVSLRLRCEAPGLQPVLLRGEEDPPAGWISRRFDERSPITVARWSGIAAPGAELRTWLQFSRVGEGDPHDIYNGS
jgi:hypothetical protein